MKQLLINWWGQLNQRERYVVSGGLLMSLLIILYYSLWLPWHTSLDNLRKDLPTRRVDLAWMQAQADVQNTIKDKVKLTNSGSLLSTLETTAKQYKVRKTIKQMSPGEAPNEVKLTLDGADFNRWLKWVSALQDKHIIIKQTTITKQQENAVNIRVVFLQP